MFLHNYSVSIQKLPNIAHVYDSIDQTDKYLDNAQLMHLYI